MELSVRACGILLHPTSLPSRHGIGDLGGAAYRFIDYLNRAHQRYWQILPLGPTGFGNSPYASTSAFAGNPLLIDLNAVAEENLCTAILDDAPDFDDDAVAYQAVEQWKMSRLRHAAERFLARATGERRAAMERFCHASRWWLDDYAMFVSIKRHHDELAVRCGAPNSAWNVFWPDELRRRCPAALANWAAEHVEAIAVEKVLQFYFFEQWKQLRSYASERGVRLIGDVPIFVALDSSDVWGSPEQFLLDDDLQPTRVAGVPPDYFSETGQRWGNPLYDWDAMRADRFHWWKRRFAAALDCVDVVRLDHFRGFQACWSIAAEDSTAINGHWADAPGDELLSEVRLRLGDFPMIAEDLGVITPEVEALRDRHGFAGMRVLQFAFDTDEPRRTHFLPHRYVPNTVVYTGTHDNDTVVGWFAGQSPADRRLMTQYVGQSCGDVSWDLIRLALASVATTVILPMQDILSLGSEARLNRPATMGSNWQWRMPASALTSSTAQRLSQWVVTYDRDTHVAPCPHGGRLDVEAHRVQPPHPRNQPHLTAVTTS